MFRLKRQIKLAFRSLLRHTLQSALSILGVICGVMTVLAMISIGEGAKRQAISQIEQLGTRNIYIRHIDLTEAQKASAVGRRSRSLSVEDAQRLKAGCAAVRDIACIREIRASTVGPGQTIMPQIIACTANYGALNLLPIAQGRFLNNHDIVSREKVCVVGNSIAVKLGLTGTSGALLRIEEELFRIVGILEKMDDRVTRSATVSPRDFNEMIFLPLGAEASVDRYEQRATTPPDTPELTEMILQIHSVAQVTKAFSVVKRIMGIRHDGVENYQIVVPQALLQQVRKTQRTFNMILGSIAGMSLLIGGIGIMNIMLATVVERTREIGVRQAVGATRENIVSQFLIEAVLMTFTGGVLGVLAGLITVGFIASFAGWQPVITSWSILLPLTTSILIGIFFGLYPAYRAAGIDPVAALRNELS
ncbi:MAG: ABC transporter permease [Thermodesulfobacteriota bacterium]